MDTERTRKTGKNIVLCSDGTGQTGARVGGTNVWKIRRGVERHDHITNPDLCRQIVFYDAGVGTSSFSVKKMLGGAFGYGLSANIRTLYTNLCKSYRDGDRIYCFGFSRGAFTARSLAGMISEVGVIDGRRDNQELEALVRRAYKAYRSAPGSGFPEKPSVPIEKFRSDCTGQGIEVADAPIHFVGVWDTVDAYGMPVDELRVLIYDKILNKIRRPHNDRLTKKMKNAYQAIAIDEDRHTFAPTLYDEEQAQECGTACEQVWFAGAHSNVGGGYARQGLSDLALYWMMTKAQACGLRFSPDAIADVQRDMDAHSTLYDQRSGGGAIWRYLPRDVGKLCAEAKTPVKIHVSAMDRMELATADYGPITLPVDFEVVGSDDTDTARVARYNNCVRATRGEREKRIGPCWKEIGRRRWDYRIFMFALLLVVALVVWLRIGGPDAVATYRENTGLIRGAGGWILDKTGLQEAAATLWTWLEKGALALTPGLVKKFVAALFKLPEGVVLIVLVGAALLWRKKRRVAKLKHLGLNLWRKCFGH